MEEENEVGRYLFRPREENEDASEFVRGPKKRSSEGGFVVDSDGVGFGVVEGESSFAFA